MKFRDFIKVDEGFKEKLDKMLLNFSKKIDGDNRTPKELVKQIHGLSDKALKMWYDGYKGRFGDYTRLFQNAGVKKEMERRNLI